MVTNRFCVVKHSRAFAGHGYSGPTLGRAGYQQTTAEFDKLEVATACANKLKEFNEVGWCVYDKGTFKKLYDTTTAI